MCLFYQCYVGSVYDSHVKTWALSQNTSFFSKFGEQNSISSIMEAKLWSFSKKRKWSVWSGSQVIISLTKFELVTLTLNSWIQADHFLLI